MPLEGSSLRVLAAIVAEDRRALQRLDGALEKFGAGVANAAWDSAEHWASAGVPHGIYNAIENSFLRISHTLGDKFERSDRWHAELLHRMFHDVPELRPAVVPSRLRPLLKELLAFRHLYRHGYDLQLDGVKLNDLIEHWKKERDAVFAAFDTFHAHLLHTANAPKG